MWRSKQTTMQGPRSKPLTQPGLCSGWVSGGKNLYELQLQLWSCVLGACVERVHCCSSPLTELGRISCQTSAI